MRGKIIRFLLAALIILMLAWACVKVTRAICGELPQDVPGVTWRFEIGNKPDPSQAGSEDDDDEGNSRLDAMHPEGPVVA